MAKDLKSNVDDVRTHLGEMFRASPVVALGEGMGKLGQKVLETGERVRQYFNPPHLTARMVAAQRKVDPDGSRRAVARDVVGERGAVRGIRRRLGDIELKPERAAPRSLRRRR